jgi:hypothetical protein
MIQGHRQKVCLEKLAYGPICRDWARNGPSREQAAVVGPAWYRSPMTHSPGDAAGTRLTITAHHDSKAGTTRPLRPPVVSRVAATTFRSRVEPGKGGKGGQSRPASLPESMGRIDLLPLNHLLPAFCNRSPHHPRLVISSVTFRRPAGGERQTMTVGFATRKVHVSCPHVYNASPDSDTGRTPWFPPPNRSARLP